MKKLFFVLLFAVFILAISLTAADKAMNESGVKAVIVKENLYRLEGTRGGNVAFLVTAKGVLVVDSGTSFEEGAQIIKAIRKVTSQPIRYVVLTHFHGDHTMGLPVFPETALVIGQHNVTRNIKENNIPRLPDQTFARSMIINLGGEAIHLIYPEPAHTNCNILVFFSKQKTVHMGDMFFHESLPYIDFQNGANTANWLKQLAKVQNWDVTTVIPGHGPLSDKEGLKKQIAYLTFLRQAVTNELLKGSGLETMKTAIVLPVEYRNWQFQSVFPRNIEAVYREITTPVQEKKEEPRQ